MSGALLTTSSLPLPLWRRGKVRDVYEVDTDRLLLVASDRVSAFDVVMTEAVPDKGRVLTQLSAFWFQRLSSVTDSHFLTASTAAILVELPMLAPFREELAGRSMLVRRTAPVPFECVVRGYLAGSAWAEYRERGTLAGEALGQGLVNSAAIEPPLFSPATKAESGHDENVPFAQMRAALGSDLADGLRAVSLALYTAGRNFALERGLLIADTKFEFGYDGKTLTIADEMLTPDSSRFWPASTYRPGGPQVSLDKQFVRDYVEGLGWDKRPPAPGLPEEIVQGLRSRYLDIFRRLTGKDVAL